MICQAKIRVLPFTTCLSLTLLSDCSQDAAKHCGTHHWSIGLYHGDDSLTTAKANAQVVFKRKLPMPVTPPFILPCRLTWNPQNLASVEKSLLPSCSDFFQPRFGDPDRVWVGRAGSGQATPRPSLWIFACQQRTTRVETEFCRRRASRNTLKIYTVYLLPCILQGAPCNLPRRVFGKLLWFRENPSFVREPFGYCWNIPNVHFSPSLVSDSPRPDSPFPSSRLTG